MNPAPGKMYLDTNVFIDAFEERSERSDLLTQLFASNAISGMRFATSELTLSELLVKPYRDADGAAIDRYQGFILASEWLDAVPVDRSVLQYAAVLRSQDRGLKLPDAIHVSTAIAAECSHFLTGDHGISGVYEPDHLQYGNVKRASALAVLRPDIPTLTSVLQSLTS